MSQQTVLSTLLLSLRHTAATTLCLEATLTRGNRDGQHQDEPQRETEKLQNIKQERRGKDLIVRHLEGEKVSVSSCRTDL